MLSLIIFIFGISGSWSADILPFPDGFRFGAASSAYQVEGAWNVKDKAESIWDRMTHERPELIANGSTGDVACDSFNKYKEDVGIAKQMGLHFYRFSISWSRLMPSPFTKEFSKSGHGYYNNLIEELRDKGIEPVVTMFHWDLPQKLQQHGGWSNPLIIDWFANYARTLYDLYGDRVKTWITFSEPIAFCNQAYFRGKLAPGIVDANRGSYLCARHVLLAHAAAWRLYDEKYKPKFGGKVSIANQLVWFEGATKEDDQLARSAGEYFNGLYSHPIYSPKGGWPPEIEKALEEKINGSARSMLPKFSDEEIKHIKGTFDFYGLIYYTRQRVSRSYAGQDLQHWLVRGALEPGAEGGPWLEWHQVPGALSDNAKGLRYVLKWLKSNYGNLTVFIVENGYPSEASDIEDTERINYLTYHMEQMLRAVHEDQVNVTGYAVWSLMDNFDWNNGYRLKYGLYAVNFTEPSRPRKPRKSSIVYTDVITQRKLQCDPLMYI